jgi:hypothetical protein
MTKQRKQDKVMLSLEKALVFRGWEKIHSGVSFKTGNTVTKWLKELPSVKKLEALKAEIAYRPTGIGQ